ncbi:MAG: class C sortase [Clostridiales Family XIII bacterium]|jgi:sortase A|nr:class C sortase [Clostridiales Family XIII bacterium]
MRPISNRKVFIAAALALILGGAAVFAFPWVSSWWNARQSAEMVAQYEAAGARLSAADVDEQFELARAYNEKVSGLAPYDPFTQKEPVPFPEYNDILMADASGVMASLEVPAIGLTLPVYHGVADAALERGAGHMPTTALPVGGAGTHCVIVGHNGLPSRELFTHLDKLEVGDGFILHVLGRSLGYRVETIFVTEPEETKPLLPVVGVDYCSLVTCTPYGINSHRLILRGLRDDSVITEQIADRRGPFAGGLTALQRAGLIAAAAVAAALALVWFFTRRRKQTQAQTRTPESGAPDA